jgi:hypothetical protein
MAEILDYSDTYVDFVAPSAQEIGSYYTNVAKKNKNSSNPLNYVWGKYQQDQKEYELKNPVMDAASFIAEKAPDVLYYGGYADGTFEKAVIDIIKTEGVTPEQVRLGVQGLIDNGVYQGDVSSNPLAPFNFAQQRYQEWSNAKRDYVKQYENWYEKSPLGLSGIPSPDENYNPLTFKSYKKWEDEKIKTITDTLGDKFTPSLKTKVERVLRARAVEAYRKAGRTPYQDAVVRLEAMK